MSEKTTYRISGLSCTNCAAKFEKNVQNISGVTDADLNFGAGKITVEGHVTLEELEAAGAFDNLHLQSIGEPIETKVSSDSFIKRHLRLIIAVILISIAFSFQFFQGENSSLATLFYLSAILIGGFSLFIEGFKDLMKLNFSMETLMTIAIIGASLIGQWAEGAVVVLLFAISEALERYSMEKARQSIRSLMDIAPKEALIKRNGVTLLLPVSDVQIDDIMIVKPGQKLAMDGVIVKGHSAINQAAITGESVPIEKTVTDDVFAGTLNGEGALEVQVTKKVTDTTIAKIIHLVEEAQGEKAPSQAFVDKFAKFYTPTIIAIAALTMVFPPLFLGGDWNTWLYQGLSLLVVGCPCSLVISTPVSIVSAIGNAAKNGVLIKGGIYLEEIGGLKAIAFDKTGTLTEGKPIVTDFITNDSAEEDHYLTIIAALESLSQHPLASAIINEAKEKQLSHTVTINNFYSITGKGIRGDYEGTTYLVGNPKLFSNVAIESSPLMASYQHFQNEGKTVMLFGKEKEILAIIAVADKVRDSSASIIKTLHQLGIKQTIMLTGDNNQTAKAIGQQVGVTTIKGELMPEDKLDYIKSLKQSYENVAMIGDGINDAPALASATVGIAMGGAGEDTALETADVALMGDDLQKLPFLIKLSRKTLKIIKQNITFSLMIKLLAVLLIIPGWLTLWIAILADMGATLLVTLNGLRLMKVK